MRRDLFNRVILRFGYASIIALSPVVVISQGGGGSWTATSPYGTTAYHSSAYGTTAYGTTASGGYHSYGGTYASYHPPITVHYYSSSCGNCGGWSAASAAAAGATDGTVAGAAVASATTAAATSRAYSAGYAAGATHGDVVQPARAHAQMLDQAHGGIGRQRETGHAQAVYVRLGHAGLPDQRAQCAPQPPVGGVRGIALVRDRDGQGRHDAVIAQAAHRGASWRFFMPVVSTQRAVPGKVGASAFISPRWILLVVVSGRLSTNAT